jgi:hypothetical protein
MGMARLKMAQELQTELGVGRRLDPDIVIRLRLLAFLTVLFSRPTVKLGGTT